MAAGSAATGPLIAWLVGAGWRQSLLAAAPLAFAIAALWWWYARDRPAEHASVNAAELDFIGGAGRRGNSPIPAPGGGGRRPAGAAAHASYFCSNYVFYFFFNWLFIYLV